MRSGESASTMVIIRRYFRKMDFGIFGPKEAYGFSRGARGTLSAPSFDDCAFDFDGKTTRG